MDPYLNLVNPSNPWARNPHHPLDVFLQTNQRNQETLLTPHQVEEAFAETRIAEHMELLTKMTSLSSDLYKLRKEIRVVKHDKKYSDVARADALEKKLEMVKSLVDDFDLVVKNQDTFSAMLQQPYDGEHLKIEAKYHADTVQFFENVVKSVSRLNEQCEILRWHKDNDYDFEKTQQTLKEISDCIERMENYLS